MSENISMTPREVVEELNRYIIGQDEAKRSVAIAVRDRWRRSELRKQDSDLSSEITPKNILMIGPTGVGKTEIARRLAKLTNAPFLKVEATKFTEVGYVGRDVETIVRDLADIAIKLERENALAKVKHLAEDATEDRILNALLPQPKSSEYSHTETEDDEAYSSPARQLLRKQLREGELDEKEMEIELSSASVGVEIVAPPGMEEMTNQLQSMFQHLNSDRKKLRKLKVKDALKVCREEEAAKLLNDDDIKTAAIENVEQNGIVFIDEIDKVSAVPITVVLMFLEKVSNVIYYP